YIILYFFFFFSSRRRHTRLQGDWSSDVYSSDLYSTVVPDATIHFVGYRRDGSTITTDVDRHGIVFQTYNFGPDWSGLTRVEIPTYGWSLDNAVISIPEPSTGALLVIAVIAFGSCRRAVSVIPLRKVSDSC